MNRYSFSVACVIALAACSRDATFEEPLPPYAPITWLNAVSDTGQLDIRVVDIPTNAGFFDANFRSALMFPDKIEAGQRRVKVFMSSTDPAIAQIELVDTTYTFTADQPHTFFVGGFARTGQTPAVRAGIVPFSPPTPGAGQIAIRVLNLAPTFAGAQPTLADTTVAAEATVRKITALFGGTPEIPSVGYLQASSYAVVDTGRYWIRIQGAGSGGPGFALVPLPLGTAGTGANNPIAGSRVGGSVLTAVILPRSVSGSSAPQGGRPTSRNAEIITRSNDTVTVQSGSISRLVNRSPAAADSTVATTGTGATTGATALDVVLVAGATEPEYNGWQVVLAVADSLSCVPVDAGDTATRCNATNAVATTRFRYRYRIAGTPTSPATGTATYRIYSTTAADFTIPYVTFLVDRRPPNTIAP